MKTTGEKVTPGPDYEKDWVCVCGNIPESDGFYPCDEDGLEIEPTKESRWSGLYVCARCSRIIDQETLEVVGLKAPSMASEESKETIKNLI